MAIFNFSPKVFVVRKLGTESLTQTADFFHRCQATFATYFILRKTIKPFWNQIRSPCFIILCIFALVSVIHYAMILPGPIYRGIQVYRSKTKLAPPPAVYHNPGHPDSTPQKKAGRLKQAYDAIFHRKPSKKDSNTPPGQAFVEVPAMPELSDNYAPAAAVEPEPARADKGLNARAAFSISNIMSATGAPSGGPPGVKLYIGRLPMSAQKRELEELFGKYGRMLGWDSLLSMSGCQVISIEIKHGGFAFVEYGNIKRDAEDAIKALDGYPMDGERLTVEIARRSGAGGPTSTCFVCAKPGHWARECPDNHEQGMDVRSGKCFRCGEGGHLARFCRNVDGGGDRRRSRSPGYRRHSPQRFRDSRDRGGYDRYDRDRYDRDRYDRDRYDRDRYDDRYDDRRRMDDRRRSPPRGRYDDDDRRPPPRREYDDRGYPPPRGPAYDDFGREPYRNGGGDPYSHPPPPRDGDYPPGAYPPGGVPGGYSRSPPPPREPKETAAR
ncbi:hypothetical protein HDU67_008974 [Dinochytrium kinnereticum]|nr:hypothetical protein HDU67_008974 [Dinochytrium kinnereticum]